MTSHGAEGGPGIHHAQHTTPAPVEGSWWSPHGRYGDTVVLHVDLSAHDGREREALACLDEPELSRRNAYLYPGPRRRFSLCRAALRAILAGHLGCRTDQIAFAATEHGKPFALLRGRPAPVSFNLSHSGEHGLIAVAPAGRLGVDVEERTARRDLDGLAGTVFGPEERTEFAATPESRKLQMFFRLWTIKEAIIKAFGTGHTLDVSGVQVPAPMRGGARTGTFRFSQTPGADWRIDDLGNEAFAAALAHEVFLDE